MTRKIIISIILTLAILTVAKRLSMNKPERVHVTEGGIRLSHTSVFEYVGEGFPVVTLEMEPSADQAPEIIYHMVKTKQQSDMGEVRVGMTMTRPGFWEGKLPSRPKGERLEYAFEFRSGDSVMRLPEEPGKYFLLKYKGAVSNTVLILHIFFMFGAFFFIMLTALCAADMLRGRADAVRTSVMMRWVLLFTFIGGYPLGFILNWQRFGFLWEGYPFGYDITDNKTQVMFVFWVLTAILAKGSMLGRGEQKNLVGRRGYGAAVMVSFIVSLAIFLIPHSL